jgi:hypothetical protein
MVFHEESGGIISYMNPPIHLLLNTTLEQAARLKALQVAFAEVCNAVAPVVQQSRCWNRVALHHLTYHGLRQRFPQIGSQMVCNAIYSVSRTCRLVLQHPSSPFNVSKHPERPLPLLQFLPSAPVYFDRHTLSLKDGLLSLYTLDGRMRFQLALSAEAESRFHREKLREIVLARTPLGYQLSFWLSMAAEDEERWPVVEAEMPEYVVVHSTQPEVATGSVS